MKTFLSKTFVLCFKRLGFAGALRWRILYWTYKIRPGLHIRQDEWTWVLNYLPKLGDWQEVRVLDVGCTSSLFTYEIARRGYDTRGIDIRPYQEKVSEWMFIQSDITKVPMRGVHDFVICISVLEHIPKEKQHDAIDNMMKSLKIGGRLLLTIPTHQYAQGHPWEGFDCTDFDFHNDKAKILEYTERQGQICMAIQRIV